MITIDKFEGIKEKLASIVRYPAEHKQNRLRSFLAQVEGWNKWFYKAIENAKIKPEKFIVMMDDLLKNKNEESIKDFYASIINLTDWGFQDFNWLKGNMPIADI